MQYMVCIQYGLEIQKYMEYWLLIQTWKCILL